jgi:outer membrane lipoprotein carrier protein
MKIQTILLSTILLISAITEAKVSGADIKKALSNLRQSPMVTLEVEKKTKSELMGTETIAPGTIYLSPKKFRWDSKGNENSKIYYDGKTIWTIQEPPKGFKAPPQITKMKMDKKSESQIFLNSLFKENFNDQFKLIKKTKINDVWEFRLRPLKKNLGVKELSLKITDKNQVKEISYVDEIQNKIVIQINKTTFSKKLNAATFQFKPPAGSRVNEL